MKPCANMPLCFGFLHKEASNSSHFHPSQPCCSICAITLCICYNLIVHTLISTPHSRQLEALSA
jgi:hypothetical protein